MPIGDDHPALDMRTLAVASSVIRCPFCRVSFKTRLLCRLLIETKEVVQVKIESVVPPLHVLSSNFVSRRLLPCLGELWKHYDPQVPKSSLFKKAFEAEAEIKGVIQALDRIDDILKARTLFLL